MYGYKTSYGTNLYSAYSKGKYSETILATMTKYSNEIEKLFISQVLVKISQGCKYNPNLLV